MLSFDPERRAVVLAPLGAIAITAGVVLFNPLGIALILFGLTLLAFSCLSREDGFLFTGPFIGYELRRSVRRSRLHLWWGLLAGVTTAAVLTGYGFVVYDNVPRKQASDSASIILLFIGFYLFMICLSVIITLMSYCIAEDRDGKRLDFLLASDLRSREIILGKMIGRMIAGLSYPVVLLPFAVLLPALFGVDPAILLCMASIAGVSLFSMAGLSVLSSTLAATKKAGGTVMTMFVAPYILVGLGLNSLASYPAIWFFPGSPVNIATFSVSDAIELFNVGNPIIMFPSWINLGVGMPSLKLSAVLREIPGYAAFHIGTGLFSILLAIRLLRSKSASMADRKANEGPDKKAVPPVSDRPIAWKERYFIPAVVKARRSRSLRLVPFVLLVLPCLIFLASAVSDLGGYAPVVQQFSSLYPCIMGWIFSIAGSRIGLESIVRERDKDTMTSLLLTDFDAKAIVNQKIRGVLMVMWSSWLALSGVAVCSSICGGMLWWVVIGFTAMLFIFGTFFVMIGFQTSAKATSLEAASKVFGWKIAPCAIVPPLCFMGVAVSHKLTLTPEEAMIWSSVIAGVLAVYALGAWLLWRSAVKRFLKSCDPASEVGPLLDNPAKSR
ncbi:hypothetical protein BH11PLA2_BH11PLA2_30220 [soil metagenome]